MCESKHVVDIHRSNIFCFFYCKIKSRVATRVFFRSLPFKGMHSEADRWSPHRVKGMIPTRASCAKHDPAHDTERCLG